MTPEQHARQQLDDLDALRRDAARAVEEIRKLRRAT